MSNPRILVCGWIGSANLGDELIASEVAELVRAEGCEPTLVTIDPDRSRAFGCPVVRHARAHHTIGLARAAWSHDGVLFGGGGLIQDETGPLNIPFHLSRLAAGRLLRRPWAGIALGVGEVRRRSGRMLARRVLQSPVACTVRDAASVDRWEALTGFRPTLGIDPVLAVAPTEPPVSPHLMVSLRPANRPEQRQLDSHARPSAVQIRRWAAAIDEIATTRGWSVRFVAWDNSHDALIHEQTAALLTVSSTLESPTAEAVMDRMGDGAAVLTMRYHGAVAAIRSSRPALVLDYSPKMADLVGEIDEGLVLVAPDAESKVMVEAFNQLPAGTVRRSLGDLEPRVLANRDVVRVLAEACGT
jgi:polysaccharide pyruvyl transferase WcaK-like protein